MNRFPLAIQLPPAMLDAVRRAARAAGVDPDDGSALATWAGDMVTRSLPVALADLLGAPHTESRPALLHAGPAETFDLRPPVSVFDDTKAGEAEADR
jgi:hypothetical protein